MLFKNLIKDIDSVIARDPAARSRLEVVLTYPGFHAVLWHRAAHWLWNRRWHLTARMLSHLSRLLTGIDIHPGARIGKRLFIDHGTGLVIGETSEVGDDVTLYQCVTLGGVAPSIDSAAQANRKRHPTLANSVIVGSGAQVLGPITLGEGARVGANAVVVSDVPPGATVVGIPARIVAPRVSVGEFHAYGMPQGQMPDPVAQSLDGLADRIAALKAQIEVIERRLSEQAAPRHGEEAPAGGEANVVAVEGRRRRADF